MSWLRRVWERAMLRRAARRYARLLGPRLRQDYGVGAHYTAAQIRAAAGRAGLGHRFIAIGYAAFLTEAAFDALGLEGDYAALRESYFRHVLPASGSGADPARENIDAVTGYIGGQNG